MKAIIFEAINVLQGQKGWFLVTRYSSITYRGNMMTARSYPKTGSREYYNYVCFLP